jgi:hypothetical protein
MLRKMLGDIGKTPKNVSKATRGTEKALRRVLGRLFKDVRCARKV